MGNFFFDLFVFCLQVCEFHFLFLLCVLCVFLCGLCVETKFNAESAEIHAEIAEGPVFLLLKLKKSKPSVITQHNHANQSPYLT